MGRDDSVTKAKEKGTNAGGTLRRRFCARPSARRAAAVAEMNRRQNDAGALTDRQPSPRKRLLPEVADLDPIGILAGKLYGAPPRPTRPPHRRDNHPLDTASCDFAPVYPRHCRIRATSWRPLEVSTETMP